MRATRDLLRRSTSIITFVLIEHPCSGVKEAAAPDLPNSRHHHQGSWLHPDVFVHLLLKGVTCFAPDRRWSAFRRIADILGSGAPLRRLRPPRHTSQVRASPSRPYPPAPLACRLNSY